MPAFRAHELVERLVQHLGGGRLAERRRAETVQANDRLGPRRTVGGIAARRLPQLGPTPVGDGTRDRAAKADESVLDECFHVLIRQHRHSPCRFGPRRDAVSPSAVRTGNRFLAYFSVELAIRSQKSGEIG
jgi:hypothetical protein